VSSKKSAVFIGEGRGLSDNGGGFASGQADSEFIAC
jgi:hypothetical protein